AIRVDPVADRVPLRAVPLLELHRAAALVVRARELDGLEQAERAQLLQARVVDVQVLEAPAHLFTGERALAELRLRDADRLDVQDRVLDAEVVVDAAEALGILEVALALVEDVLLDLLQHREVGARRTGGDRDVALGGRAGGRRVLFGVRPDVAYDVVDGEAGA